MNILKDYMHLQVTGNTVFLTVGRCFFSHGRTTSRQPLDIQQRNKLPGPFLLQHSKCDSGSGSILNSTVDRIRCLLYKLDYIPFFFCILKNISFLMFMLCSHFFTLSPPPLNATLSLPKLIPILQPMSYV